MVVTNPEPIAIYAVVTKSHNSLLREWFLKTMPRDCSPKVLPLAAAPVSFRSGHWHLIFMKKIELILEAIQKHQGSVIIASDVDIQFFRPIAAEIRALMESSDILFQNSTPQNPPSLSNLCAGFTAIRCCKASTEFFEEGLRRVGEKNHGSYDDQVAYQEMCQSETGARVGLLPTTYWTCGRIWFPGDALEVPQNVAIHHAAWIIGNEGKRLQLEEVRKIVCQRAYKASPQA